VDSADGDIGRLVTSTGALHQPYGTAADYIQKLPKATQQLPQFAGRWTTAGREFSALQYCEAADGTLVGWFGLLGMPNRTQIISGFLDFVTFLVIEVLAGWLRFALVLDRTMQLCGAFRASRACGRRISKEQARVTLTG
jgi:hypothetical protein